MNCTQCAALMVEDDRFCPQCGHPAPAEEPVDLHRSQAFRTGQLAARSTGSLVPIPAAQPDTEAIHALLTQANLYRVRGNWAKAIDRCVTVLRAEPGNQSAHSLLGDIYRDQGKMDDAIQWYRMAVELQPNPMDEAKLAQAEQMRAQTQTSVSGALSSNALLPSANPYAGPPAGTAALMGMSPRRWLRGVTAASLGFLALVLVMLVVTRSNHLKSDPVPRPLAMPGAATGDTGILPPANLNGAILPPGSPAISKVDTSPAGTGFAPDAATSNSGSSPAVQPREQPENASSLQPAPVTQVRPLIGSVPTGREVTAPNAPAARWEDIPLTAEMRVTQVRPEAGNGSVAITIAAPALLQHAPARATLVRNAYRAARAVFNTDTTLTRAVITIQSEPAGETLFTGEIDRIAAIQSSPDNEPLDRLEAGLRNSTPSDTNAPVSTPENDAASTDNDSSR